MVFCIACLLDYSEKNIRRHCYQKSHLDCVLKCVEREREKIVDVLYFLNTITTSSLMINEFHNEKNEINHCNETRRRRSSSNEINDHKKKKTPKVCKQSNYYCRFCQEEIDESNHSQFARQASIYHLNSVNHSEMVKHFFQTLVPKDLFLKIQKKFGFQKLYTQDINCETVELPFQIIPHQLNQFHKNLIHYKMRNKIELSKDEIKLCKKLNISDINDDSGDDCESDEQFKDHCTRTENGSKANQKMSYNLEFPPHWKWDKIYECKYHQQSSDPTRIPKEEKTSDRQLQLFDAAAEIEKMEKKLKEKDRNPNRVGAHHVLKRKLELALGVDGEDDDWLPNFGPPMMTGSRSQELERFKKKLKFTKKK